ncbi:MAG: Sec-C motif domain protein [Crocinitomicaceae bacterium]|nr:Sec-C motif domain protein [Crocinitomicaceae bacterium]
MKCPCGRNKEYEDCCAKPHHNLSNALTAEDLMRSRFTAFTKADGEYILLSHHSDTRPENSDTVVAWAKSMKWLKLEILNTTGGDENDSEGTVEFKAHYIDKGRRLFMHEDSKFVREYGNWVYLGFNSMIQN